MILNKETAQKTAELLLQINAIKLQPQEPFTGPLDGAHLSIVTTA